MFRTMLTITCACILVITSISIADFPAEEAWRVELDTTATVLGPSWQDDEGQTFFLISTSNQVLIVSEDEIIWESPELSGYVSALEHADFGVGDGPEIIAATVDADSGRIHSFSGDDFDEHGEHAILGEWGHIDPYSGGVEESNRRITTLGVFECAFPDSNKEILIGNRGFYGSGSYGGAHSSEESGRIYRYSLRNNGLFDSLGIGTVVESKIFNFNNDEQVLIVGFHWCGEYRCYQPPVWTSSSSCGVRLLNNNVEIVNNIVFASYRGDTDQFRNLARYYALQTSNIDDDDLLFSSYRDSEAFRLAKLTIPDLEIVRCITTGRAVRDLQIYNLQDDDAPQYLICFCSDNWTYIVDIDDFAIVRGGVYLDLPRILKTSIGNFDDDEDLEMAVLTTEAFVMYDLGRLSVPSTSEPPWSPERYAITAAYPNPFNSSTRIEYSVSQPGWIALTLHDLTGREVVQLADGWRSAGNYNLVLNANNLPSGSYLIRFDAGYVKDSRRIVLVR